MSAEIRPSVPREKSPRDRENIAAQMLLRKFKSIRSSPNLVPNEGLAWTHVVDYSAHVVDSEICERLEIRKGREVTEIILFTPQNKRRKKRGSVYHSTLNSQGQAQREEDTEKRLAKAREAVLGLSARSR